VSENGHFCPNSSNSPRKTVLLSMSRLFHHKDTKAQSLDSVLNASRALNGLSDSRLSPVPSRQRECPDRMFAPQTSCAFFVPSCLRGELRRFSSSRVPVFESRPISPSPSPPGERLCFVSRVKWLRLQGSSAFCF
jgi:hypothetical protein